MPSAGTCARGVHVAFPTDAIAPGEIPLVVDRVWVLVIAWCTRNTFRVETRTVIRGRRFQVVACLRIGASWDVLNASDRKPITRTGAVVLNFLRVMEQPAVGIVRGVLPIFVVKPEPRLIPHLHPAGVVADVSGWNGVKRKGVVSTRVGAVPQTAAFFEGTTSFHRSPGGGVRFDTCENSVEGPAVRHTPPGRTDIHG